MAPLAVEDIETNDGCLSPRGAITPSIEPHESNTSHTSALLHRSLNHEPPTVIDGNGIYLTLASGKKIIDACGGAAVSVLGHRNEEVSNSSLCALS